MSRSRPEPVTGLGVDDFTLRHDGDPVTITHFSEVRADAAGEAARAPPVASDPASAEPPPPAPRPSLAGSPPGHLVVYFDQNRLSPGSYPRVAEALDQVLAEGAVPAERVLVLRQDENLHLEVPFGSSAGDTLGVFPDLQDVAVAFAQEHMIRAETLPPTRGPARRRRWARRRSYSRSSAVSGPATATTTGATSTTIV